MTSDIDTALGLMEWSKRIKHRNWMRRKRFLDQESYSRELAEQRARRKRLRALELLAAAAPKPVLKFEDQPGAR